MASVLVVEDDPDLREIECAVLEFCGFSVRLAGNGIEALELLEAQPPSVILLDLMMPVMDGLTFLSERQRRRLAPDVPVVCVSAAGEHLKFEAMRLGAAEFIQKPADIDHLCERVSRYCGVQESG